MKLISCHIENFGRLRNFDHTFEDGLNLFLRENGWGKSTLAAFLCAMFYGMPGTRRRAAGENDRVIYRPWQGGTFGGKILFESGGHVYELTRIFGKKESEDVFDLRDAETNLPDFRFSARIGEELFGLDRESFRRTVFVGQLDCATRTTDNVNALLADLAEQTGDLGGYEDAMKRLTDAANRLTPKRRTGSLYRRAEQIRLLERETAGASDLDRQIGAQEQRRCGAEQRVDALERETRRLEAELASAQEAAERWASAEEAARSRAAGQEILRRLLETEETRRRSLETAAAAFPGRIPPRAEVEEHLRKCRDLERLEYKMQENMLSEEEQTRLTELEEIFLRGDPDGDAYGDEAGRIQVSALLPAACGVIVLIAGAFLAMRGYLTAGALLAAAGAFLAAADWKLSGGGRKRPGSAASAEYSRADARDPDRMEYDYLQKKERMLEETHARWAEVRRPVAAFLRDLGFAPQEDLRSQLEEIRDAVDTWEDAQTLLREAETQRRELEEEGRRQERRQLQQLQLDQAAFIEKRTGHREAGAFSMPSSDPHAGSDVLDQPERADTADLPEMPDARRLRALRQKLETERNALAGAQRALDEAGEALKELRLEQTELEEAAGRLQTLRAEQETETAAYHRVITAAVFLRRARESLTTRYADPVRRNFSYYWEKITKTSAAGVYLDADSQITVEEAGRQREIDSFSTGYRDLAGVCLRIALADAMYPDPAADLPPLILDDPFTSLDDDKMAGAMRLLEEAAQRYQILYFTCSRSRCGPSFSDQ